MGLSEATLRALDRATGPLASDVVDRMAAELPWFPALSADQRSAVGLVAQSGVRGFVRWCREHDEAGGAGAPAFPPLRPADLFGTAPRQLTRAVSLQQTVALVRMAIATCEARLGDVVDGHEAREAREMLLRYAREVAFLAADVYARAAETRGAWDARLETLVVDAVVRGDRDETLASQASALSWDASVPTSVVVAEAGDDQPSPSALRRVARDAGAEIIAGRQGPLLIYVVGGPADAMEVARALLPFVGDGPVVVGPPAPGLPTAAASARAALSGAAAARAWSGAPRPVAAGWLLPERVLAGDATARAELLEHVHAPLAAAGGDLLATAVAYLAHGGTLEATARQLFVHPNTVRYRLGRIAAVTGLHPSDPRERWTLQVALTLGRLTGEPLPSPAALPTTALASVPGAA